MKYRQLGRTGLQVSEIGFGAWGIGGSSKGAISYGPTDDSESCKALLRAFDLGITFYDTADLYGYGHSEKLLGTTFHNLRHRVVIASKVGLLDQSGAQDFSPPHIRSSLEATLKRLNSDYIDLYQLHDPPIGLIESDPSICETLGSLRKEGKIRAYGISLRHPDDSLIATGKLGFAAVQVNFNMIDQRLLENGSLGACRDRGVGIISRTPLCFGFLTGKYPAQTQFHAQDHRSKWPSRQVELWANAYRLFRCALPLNGQTDAQIALRYCLSYPEISTAIPGMLLDTEVEENVAASALGPLSEREREDIEAIYNNYIFFLGAGKSAKRP